MHRFFIPDISDISDSKAFLSVEDSRHAVKVLRLGVGDELCICDTLGYDYDGKIVSASPDAVSVSLRNKRPCETESHIKISLIQCLPKSGKMEVIIQKCVELGVCDFYPVESERCVVRVDKKSAQTKLSRYNKIAYEAAKQSGRGIIPKVHGFSTLSEFDFSGYDVVIIPYEEATEPTLKRFVCEHEIKQGAKIAIVIGTEGGFAKSEVESVVNKGGVSVTLGKRILRTETAGMATVAMLMGLAEG